MVSSLRADTPALDGRVDAERLDDLVPSLLEQNAQLRTALESRIVIEQAKGVLSERFGLDVEQAFHLLRRSARNHRMSIHALASHVVSTRTTPPEIQPPHAA